MSTNKSLKDLDISFKLTVINNGSHLGSEEDSIAIYPVVLVVYVYLLFTLYKHQSLNNGKDWYRLVVMLAILAKLLGLYCKLIGLTIYSRTGIYYKVF